VGVSKLTRQAPGGRSRSLESAYIWTDLAFDCVENAEGHGPRCALRISIPDNVSGELS
jgi:hypothetical protein